MSYNDSDLGPAHPTPVRATPVVLVHGLRISGAALHRIADAVGDRPTICPDLPGHGARTRETFTMAGAVTAVRDAVEDIGTPAVIAGMSLGGYVAMATAAAHPECVAGLVAMGSTAQPSKFLATPFRLFGAATGFLPAQSAEISRVLTRLALGRRVADDMEAGGLALAAISDVVDEIAAFDALGALAAYSGPMLFANGGWDQFRIHEKRFAALSAHAEVRVISRATHLYPLIQPQLTGTMIGDFATAITAQTTHTQTTRTGATTDDD